MTLINRAGFEVAHALGLKKVRSMTLRFNLDEISSVEAEQMLTDEQTGKVAAVMRTYELTAKADPAKWSYEALADQYNASYRSERIAFLGWHSGCDALYEYRRNAK